jgi:hypothetical protein
LAPRAAFYRAASVVTGCKSYAGEYPGEWDYAGREWGFFVAERAVHAESLKAHGLPRPPPNVLVAQAEVIGRRRDVSRGL